MAELEICRICLKTDTKVHDFKQNGYRLKTYFEEITALQIDVNDTLLPHYFCYECVRLLYKFHEFRDKCYRGQELLKEMLWAGPITYASVKSIDRDSKNLRNPLQISPIISLFYHPEDTNSIIKVEQVIRKAEFDDDNTNEDNPLSDRDEPIETDTKANILKINPVAVDNKTIKTVALSAKMKTQKYPKRDLKQNIKKKPMVKVINRRNIKLVDKNAQLKRKERSEKRVIFKKKAKCKMIVKKQKKFPNPLHWKLVRLSEEEAMKQFQARKTSSKYTNAVYKCTDCFKGFSTSDIFHRHKILRHNESKGRFECRFCRMRFKKNCELTRHMLQHIEKYECLRCPFVCILACSAKLHDELHSGVKRKCETCNEEFRFTSTYYTHMRIEHKSEYLCTICGKSFVSDMGVRMHKKIKHLIDKIENQTDEEDNDTYCAKCDIKFENKFAYEEHLKYSVKHDEVDEAKSHGHIKSKKRLTRKTSRIPTTCHHCGEHFETQSACMKHHLEKHPRTCFYTQRCICDICGASVAQGSIASHRNTHTRDVVYSCDTCGRQFNSNMSLKRHQVTHTGEKPYACTLCEKRFTQSNSMKLHYRTFHLKQPYPKRNRKKKDSSQNMAITGETEWKDELDSVPGTESSLEPAPSTNANRQQRLYFI